MAFLLAAAPLIVALAIMGVLRRSAALAGSAGLAVALALSLLMFDPTTSARGAVTRAEALLGAHAEALHTAATILWIVFPALSIYELQRRSGAIDRIRTALIGLTEDRRTQAILIAWFFGLFMEGAAGFGTPVALAAPLLVGLGFAPVTAVALALVGHAAGVSFGAIGTPVFAQAEITGLPTGEIGAATAALHALLGMVLLIFLVRMADDRPLSVRDIVWTATAGICFLAPFLAIAIVVGPELPTIAGALVGGAAYVAMLRSRQAGREGIGGSQHLPADLAPYLVIVALVLATRLFEPLQQVLIAITIDWTLLDNYRGSFQPLYHPGTVLLLGFLLAGFGTGRSAHLGPAALAAAKRLAPVALALVMMLAMSRTMVHSGMIATLAEEAARTGHAWPILAPAIGVLGTFVTGSATASNILFTDFQMTAATTLSLPAVLLVAAQGFGAAVGNIVAPYNIIAGAATVGLKGREGEVLARTASACAVYTVLGGIVVLACAALSGR